ncbi:MAG: regulatory protein RecX [Ruminococcus sp.]|nr:regulatory protein RecX [Ruminococcus sp.]
MIVTAVEPRRKSLSALYIDGEFAMKLDTQTLLENRISPGVELDDEDLHRLVELSDLRRAKEKALWLISYRDHSSKELYDKLRRDYSQDAAEKALERMQELGLINDEAFASRYATELHSKHQSPSTIRYKLIQKGIDKEVAEEIVEGLDIDPTEEISALIEKKYARSLTDEKGIKRTVAALQRAGYRFSDIKSVLSDYIQDDYD